MFYSVVAKVLSNNIMLDPVIFLCSYKGTVIWVSTRQNLLLFFLVSYKARLKSVSSATKTCQKKEISPVASLDIIRAEKRITRALNRLRICIFNMMLDSVYIPVGTTVI